MAQASTKKYVKGSAKQTTFSNGGSVIRLDLLKSELDKLPVSESGYIKLELSERKEPDQYGNTHSITLNEWKPNGAPKAPTNPPIKAKSKDDLSF